MPDASLSPVSTRLDLEPVLDRIAEESEQLDREPRFPTRSIVSLREAGALAFTIPDGSGSRPPIGEEWDLVRRVAKASGSVGRILDGHLNAVERIAVCAPDSLRGQVLADVAAEGKLLGVWGADPGPDEGPPARLAGGRDQLELNGVKVFCSGAGGLDAALVMVRGETDGPPYLCLVDLDATVEIDRAWFAASGLRASESHRVVFDSTPVRALLGERGELSREPWFSRDALRTAATWAGMADAAGEDAISDLAARRRGEDLSRLAAGRISAAQGTIDAWFEVAARAVEAERPLKSLSIRLRAEVISAGRTILEEAARACGSRPFALGSQLDRARRDFELFTLQHRIDPLLIREGGLLLDPQPPG